MKKLLTNNRFIAVITLLLCTILMVGISALSISTENECTHIHTKHFANAYEHWEVCEECGDEIPLSRSQHLLSYGHCDCEAYAEYVK